MSEHVDKELARKYSGWVPESVKAAAKKEAEQPRRGRPPKEVSS